MDSADFATRFAQLRRQNNLTQEYVAHHLGITKAAVSKWECGHSFPDITLVPTIAALFSVSIDELFDYRCDLDQDRIDDITRTAMSLLASHSEGALDHLRVQAKAHWSCPELLRALALAVYACTPQQRGFCPQALEDEALECAEETARLFERALQLTGTQHLSASELTAYATVEHWLDKNDEARRLIEPLVKTEPNITALLLAQLLDAKGESMQAVRTLQQGLLFSLIEATSFLQALTNTYLNDETHLSCVMDLGRYLARHPAIYAVSPFMPSMLALVQAESEANNDHAASALAHLREFAHCLDDYCAFIEQPGEDPIFDHVGDLMCQEGEPDTHDTKNESITAVRHTFARRIASNPAWSAFAKNEEFNDIVRAIEGRDYE